MFTSTSTSPTAMPNDYGPLKSDWTKPCPFDWSKEEKLDKCISFQEAVWGTELLERLETIQSGLDPKSLFIQGYGVNGKGPNVGLDATNEPITDAPGVEEIDSTEEDPVPVKPPTANQTSDPVEDSSAGAGRSCPLLACVSVLFFQVLVMLG